MRCSCARDLAVLAEYDSTAHGMWFALLTLAAMAGLAPMVHRERAKAPPRDRAQADRLACHSAPV